MPDASSRLNEQADCVTSNANANATLLHNRVQRIAITY